VKRYKKRPIYWLFSSPKGSFNALIYMHRYRPDTVSVVLNDYLREFRTKLTSHKNHLEAVSISASSSQGEKTKALKEIEKITKMIAEMEEYEREVLYPLATEQVEIDLDDGVKVNYPKFGAALKKIVGLDRIAQALTKLFDRHRIVFWYDAKQELRDDFEALQLPGVEKLELTNNEYGIKYRTNNECCASNRNRNSCSTAKALSPPIWITGCWMCNWPTASSAPIRWPSGCPNWSSAWSSRMWCRPMRSSSRRIKRKDALKKLLKAGRHRRTDSPEDAGGVHRQRAAHGCGGGKPAAGAGRRPGREDQAGHRCNLDGFLWEQMNRIMATSPTSRVSVTLSFELFKIATPELGH
jgi:hypothetical protein